MDNLPRTITLGTLGDGAAEELFQSALAKLLQNIDDPNTDAEQKRSITVTLTAKPDEERRVAVMSISCSTKLAAVRPVASVMYIGRHKGELAAVEQYRQEEMFPQALPSAPSLVAKGGAE